MIDALYISASGLRSQQEQIDVISNNVANMQTPGFKRSRVNFAEMSSAPVAGDQAPETMSSNGAGIHVLSTSALFGAGEMRATQNPLDLAIDGAGFFELSAADGSRVYTRAGQLRIDNEGYLTSVNGLRLAQGLQIPPDATQLRIQANGEIYGRLGTDAESTLIGTIELASFAAPDGLLSIGENTFLPTSSSGDASFGKPADVGFGKLQQGFLEMANVDLVDEMSNLVIAQRAYQLNARVLQAADQVLETINNLRR